MTLYDQLLAKFFISTMRGAKNEELAAQLHVIADFLGDHNSPAAQLIDLALSSRATEFGFGAEWERGSPFVVSIWTVQNTEALLFLAKKLDVSAVVSYRQTISPSVEWEIGRRTGLNDEMIYVCFYFKLDELFGGQILHENKQ